MAKIKLADFEKRIKVRPLTLADYDAVTRLQTVCFPGMKPWSREQFESQIARFPEGQLCVEYRGKIVASSCCLIVDFDLYSDWHDWRAIADSGFIRNHDDHGDTMYGIEIMVDPKYRGMKLSRRLYDARKQLARERNVQRIIIGGRIPGYHKHAGTLSAEEYVQKVMHKNLIDPVLTAQVANGFQLQRLIPHYLPSDKESLGYATFLQWTNLDYTPDATRRFTTVQIVRVCAVQYRMRKIASFDEFAAQCEYFIDVASDYHCDFVVFPELFTTQLVSFFENRRPGEAARQLAQFTPQYLDLFTRMAVKYNINVIGGSQFLFEDDVLQNVAHLFRRDGTLERQHKLHITPSERKWWGVSPGKRQKVFETDRGKVAIQICYDIEFPELSRVAAKMGAMIVFVPFNTDERHGFLRVRCCAQARAIENHLYVVTSGCTGNLPFVDNADIHYSQSGIYTPLDFGFSRDGIAAESTPNIETVVIHDVDVEVLRRHRYSGTTQNWTDRRKDLYEVVYRADGEEMRI